MSAFEWATAWAAALDDLELTLTQSEDLLNSHGGTEDGPPAPVEPWSPPELASPLPPEMLERAQLLLARQQQMIARTTAAMTGNRQNHALVNKVTAATGVRRSAHAVYLDVRA